MQSWDLGAIELPKGTRSPVVLFSREEARAVLIAIDPGQELGEHQVKEAAFLIVVDGSAEIEVDGDRSAARSGTLVCFEPNERRRVASTEGARVLLVLAPWPGEGHYLPDEA